MGHLSTERYTSAEVLERERDLVFGRTWLSVARESDVPQPGHCLPIDELDQSLLVVRGEDGTVRTFRNTCRHRGTRLLSHRCQVKRISCPYHGWTYALDGTLRGVPKLSGFEDLDKGSHGLFEIRTECWAGFVWITFDCKAPPLREYLGELVAQIEPYGLAEMRPLYRKTWTLPCNWKAVLDQATESYHLAAVHGHSMAPVIDTAGDTVAKFHGIGRHHLQTVPIADYWWRPWLDRRSVPSDLGATPDQLRIFHKYLIFPNVVANVMPYHLTVFRVYPLTADTCRLHYEFHVRRQAPLIGKLRGWLTLLASLYVLREDFGVLVPYQAGVKAAGDQVIPTHREEQPLVYFHAVVDRYLAADRSPD